MRLATARSPSLSTGRWCGEATMPARPAETASCAGWPSARRLGAPCTRPEPATTPLACRTSPRSRTSLSQGDRAASGRLRQRQYLVPGLGDQDRVLELGRALGVLGHGGPAIGPDVILDRAERQHRLDRERQITPEPANLCYIKRGGGRPEELYPKRRLARSGLWRRGHFGCRRSRY